MFLVWLGFIQMIWFGMSHICCEVRKEWTCQGQLQQVCAHINIGYMEVIILLYVVALENSIQSVVQKFGVRKIFIIIFLSIYLIENTINMVILWNLNTVSNTCSLLEYIENVVYSCDDQAEFSEAITLLRSPQCQMTLQKSL